MKIKKIGEFGLIAYLRRRFSAKRGYIGIGDDCAFIPPDVVISSDVVVEDVHFDLSYLKPEEVGHRATTACLSDLAAAGARPTGILVSAVMKPLLELQAFKGIYRGIENVINRCNCQLLGGDLCQGRRIVLSLFGIGRTRNPLLRSGAKPGDVVYLSGYSGLSEAGRLVLKGGLSRKKYRMVVNRHIRPYPRLKQGLKLRKKASAVIDLSDGLLVDLNHIAEESGVGIEIDNVPIHPELKRLEKETGISAELLALSGGEDFELIFTSRRELRGFFRIGQVIRGGGLSYKDKPIEPSGYRHFNKKSKQQPFSYSRKV